MEASPIFFPGREVAFQTPERTLTLTITTDLSHPSQRPSSSSLPLRRWDPIPSSSRYTTLASWTTGSWTLPIGPPIRGASKRRGRRTPSGTSPFHRRDLWEDESGHPYEDRAAHATVWEKHYRRLSTESFESERDPYDRLLPLQGSDIPSLLATGIILPPDERAIQPPAVIIEYIPDAVSLCDVPVELVTPELCATLLRIVDSFGSYGVVHTDVNWNNVLFSPSTRPTRVVVIDFGCGGVRTEDEDDEDDWEECVRWGSDGPRVRWVLEQRGIMHQRWNESESESESKWHRRGYHVPHSIMYEWFIRQRRHRIGVSYRPPVAIAYDKYGGE